MTPPRIDAARWSTLIGQVWILTLLALVGIALLVVAVAGVLWVAEAVLL